MTHRLILAGGQHIVSRLVNEGYPGEVVYSDWSRSDAMLSSEDLLSRHFSLTSSHTIWNLERDDYGPHTAS
ncbi:hypothetical protein E4U56_003101 [Claviceps arundinis]|uniref:Uncharacterized protein n=1 Tax=Claviceps arundinis TaxID=1623583 RepID=A0A9P7MP61_9HYPO|nr:hypothetical protein E4U56_003101 [Claviceps arundinis]